MTATCAPPQAFVVASLGEQVSVVASLGEMVDERFTETIGWLCAVIDCLPECQRRTHLLAALDWLEMVR